MAGCAMEPRRCGFTIAAVHPPPEMPRCALPAALRHLAVTQIRPCRAAFRSDAMPIFWGHHDKNLGIARRELLYRYRQIQARLQDRTGRRECRQAARKIGYIDPMKIKDPEKKACKPLNDGMLTFPFFTIENVDVCRKYLGPAASPLVRAAGCRMGSRTR
jgi:hypothetical protein